MITDMMPLVEINQQAIRLLYQELGPANAVRFLKQFTVGFGDYTKEREKIFGQINLDEIVVEIIKRRKSSWNPLIIHKNGITNLTLALQASVLLQTKQLPKGRIAY